MRPVREFRTEKNTHTHTYRNENSMNTLQNQKQEVKNKYETQPIILHNPARQRLYLPCGMPRRAAEKVFPQIRRPLSDYVRRDRDSYA